MDPFNFIIKATFKKNIYIAVHTSAYVILVATFLLFTDIPDKPALIMIWHI